MNSPDREAQRRAEKVLARHGVKDKKTSIAQGCRPKAAINAIILDVQKANAEAEDD